VQLGAVFAAPFPHILVPITKEDAMTRLTRRLTLGAAGLVAASAVLHGPAWAQAPGESTLDRVRRTKQLRIGAVAGGAPYYIKDIAGGPWKGFYIDLSKLLAGELDAELAIVETTWGNAILELQANHIDVFFGLNPTPRRALSVDFSVPIFHNAFSLVTRAGLAGEAWENFNKPEVRIAVDAGSSHDQVVSRMCPQAQMSRFRTADEATLALQSGRVDAQCLILMLALPLKKHVPGLGPVVTPRPIFFTTSNAGFRREPDRAWRDFVNVWIDYNRSLGTVQAAIVDNMKLVGVEESDFPNGVAL